MMTPSTWQWLVVIQHLIRRFIENAAGRAVPTTQEALGSKICTPISEIKPVLNFALTLHSQRTANAGVVPEPLLTHDPSRSRFRVYFKPIDL